MVRLLQVYTIQQGVTRASVGTAHDAEIEIQLGRPPDNLVQTTSITKSTQRPLMKWAWHTAPPHVHIYTFDIHAVWSWSFDHLREGAGPEREPKLLFMHASCLCTTVVALALFPGRSQLHSLITNLAVLPPPYLHTASDQRPKVRTNWNEAIICNNIEFNDNFIYFCPCSRCMGTEEQDYAEFYIEFSHSQTSVTLD